MSDLNVRQQRRKTRKIRVSKQKLSVVSERLDRTKGYKKIKCNENVTCCQVVHVPAGDEKRQIGVHLHTENGACVQPTL